MTCLPRRLMRLTALAGLSLGLALGACSSNSNSGKGNGGSPGSGGVLGGGGTTSTGGTVATGGSTATAATGGTLPTGGSVQPSGGSTGGTSATGGSPTSGGSAATGGSTPTGGTTASGGTIAAGGTTSAGGAAGGTTVAGGTTAAGGRAGGTTASGGRTGGTTVTGGSTVAGGTTTSGGNTGGSRGGTTSTGSATGGATASGGATTGDGGILAAEATSFHCFNWADPGDNFQNGALQPTGLSSSDSYDTVLAKSNAILSGFQTVLGANSIRIPINEPTVNTATTWAAYKGIVDAAISKNMKVMIGYWAIKGGTLADPNAFYTMWQTVIDAYLSSDLVYFDIMNEPYALQPAAFIEFAVQWLAKYPSVPQNRVVVAGDYTDTDVNKQGADPRLAGCLLSLHIYDNSGATAALAEAALKTHVGPYYSRTIVTEYVGVTGFMQGITTQMKAYGMGSCYWAGLEGDSKGIAKLSGTAPNYTLTVNNASTLTLIQSGWSP